MNAAFDTHTFADTVNAATGQVVLRRWPPTRQSTGPQPCNARPCTSTYDAAIVNGTEPQRQPTPSIAAFTAVGTRNRHRTRG
ncbi:MAG: hypothetical protein IPP44_18365 [Ideonella sp.]|nr:hypothetical protein [Ideonella sp.]